MAPFDFPSAPTNGQEYQPAGGPKYTYVTPPGYWATLGAQGLAPIESPVLTGDPRAPTPPPGDDDSSIATTAFVADALQDFVSADDVFAVPNISELAQLTTRPTAVLTIDRGGGEWAFVAGDQSANVAADPMQGLWVAPVSDPTGATGAWKRVYDGSVQAEWFGVVPGSTSGPALRAAMAMMDHLGGGVLLLAEGTFELDGVDGVCVPFYDYVSLVGSGQDLTILKRAAGVQAHIMSPAGDVGKVGFTLSDMTLDGNKTAEPIGTFGGYHCFRGHGENFLTIERVTCKNAIYYGIGLQGIENIETDVRITDCFVLDNGGWSTSGPTFGDGLDVKSANRMWVTRCRAEGNAQKGFDVRGQNTFFDTCYANDNGADGFNLRGRGDIAIDTPAYIQALGCVAEDNTGNGFAILQNDLVAAGYVSLSACRANRNGANGFFCNTDTQAILITASSAFSNVGAGARLTNNNVTVVGCVFNGNGTYGFDNGALNVSQTIVGNVFLNNTTANLRAVGGSLALHADNIGTTNLDAGALTSLSSLKAFTSSRTAVVTQYRTSPGDGGGGTWVWRTGNQSAHVTGDPSQGLWVAPNSDPTGATGAWQRAYGDRIDARWFGAIGNGAADDTAAIQAGVNWVGTHTSILSIPPGNYNISDEISLAACTTRFGFVGAGPRLTRFRILNDFNGGNFNQTKKFIKGINPSTNSRTLENLLFEGFEIASTTTSGSLDDVFARKGDPIGIYLPFESGSILRDIRVRGLGNTAFWISAANNSRMERCWAFGAGGWHVTANENGSTSFTYSITAGDNTLSAVSGTPFVAGDVGKVIYLGSAGTQSFPWATTIASFTSSSSVEVTHAPTQTMTGGRVSWDGVKGSIAVGTTTLTLDVDCMEAADVGRFVYVVGAGTNGGVLATTIASRTSGTVVEVVDAALATATAQDVLFTPAYFVGSLTANVADTRKTNDIVIDEPLVEAWQGCDYLFKDAIGVTMTSVKSEGLPGSLSSRCARNARNMIFDAVRSANIDGLFMAFGYSYTGGNILVCGGQSSIRLAGAQWASLPARQYVIDLKSNDPGTTVIIDGGVLHKPDAPASEPGLVRYGAGMSPMQVFQGAPLVTRDAATHTLYNQRFPAQPGVVHVSWFGARGDNVTDDTAAVQAAFTALATTGGVIEFTAKATYKISNIVNITGSNITVRGNGATVNGAAVPVPAVFNTNCAFLVSGALAGSPTVLNTAVAEGAFQLVVASNAGYATDDTIFVWSTSEFFPEGSTISSLTKKGTLHRVRSTSGGTTINIYDGTQHSFLNATTNVQKVSTVKNVIFENLHVVMGGKNSSHCGVRFKYTENCWFKNGSITGGEDACFRAEYSWGGGVSESDISNATSPDQGTSGVTVDTGYGVAVQSAMRDFRVLNNRFRNCKHSVTGGGNYPATDVLVQGNNFEGSRTSPTAGYDAECHEECAHWTFLANTFGGSINSGGSGGLMIRGQHCEVAFNHIWNATQYAIYVHAFGTVPGGQNGINVHHNQIDGSRLYGIYVFGEVVSPVINVKLGHNTIRNALSDGIRVSVAHGVKLVANDIIDCAVNASTSCIRLVGSATAGDFCSDVEISGGMFDGSITYGVFSQYSQGVTVNGLHTKDLGNSPLRFENGSDIEVIGGRLTLSGVTTVSAIAFATCDRASVLGSFLKHTVGGSTVGAVSTSGVCNDITVIGVTAVGFDRVVNTGGTPNHVITLGNNGRNLPNPISNTATSKVDINNLPAPSVSAHQTLGASVSLATLDTYFNGPTTGAIGAAGQTWVITAGAIFSQPGAGPDFYQPQIWDGAAAVGSDNFVVSAPGGVNQPAMVQGVKVLTAATTFTLRGKNFSSTTGSLLGGSWITAQRIA